MRQSDVEVLSGNASAGSVLDLQGLLRLLRRRWLWLLTSVAMLSTVMGAAAFLLHPVYRSSTVLMPVDPARAGAGAVGSMLGQFGGLASLAGINLGSSGAETEVTLAVLKSRAFTERFIREHGLMPVLYADRWDSQRKQWLGEETSWPTLAQAAKYMDRELRVVSYDRRTGLVTVQVDWTQPELAAEWVNGMIAQVNEEMRERARTEASAALVHLQKELEGTQAVETRAAVSRLIEAQVNQKMLANVSTEYAFRVIDRAMPADAKDPVRPRKALMIAVGAALGSLLGLLAIIIVPVRR